MKRASQKLIGAATLALSLLAGRDAAAQAGPPAGNQGRVGGQRGGVTPPPGSPRAALGVQELLDAMVLNRSQKELRLTDDQYFQFLRPMQNLLAVRRKHQMGRNQLIMVLRRLTNPQADPPAVDAELDARVKALNDLEAQMAQDEQRALAAVDGTLTPFQRARFRIFEEQMEQEKLRLIAQAMKVGAPTPAPAPKTPKH